MADTWTAQDAKAQLMFVRDLVDPLISALTIHEIAHGADRAPNEDRRARLISWVAAIRSQFAGRIVDIDGDVAEQAGRMRAAATAQGAPADPIDALIAACGSRRRAAVATRNIRDFTGFGVLLVDPWAG